MNMRIVASACVAALFAAVGATAQDDDPGFIFLQKDEVALESASGDFDVRSKVIVGNPSEAGIYVMRIEFGPNVTSPPHFHDQDRFITVISGVWGFGRDASGDCGETVPMTEGAFVMHPKGAVHYDGSCNGEPVVVQIIGMGPVNTTRL
jgi:quercetin dioxygenase-like cupin family protein